MPVTRNNQQSEGKKFMHDSRFSLHWALRIGVFGLMMAGPGWAVAAANPPQTAGADPSVSGETAARPDWAAVMAQTVKRVGTDRSLLADQARSRAERARADGMLAGAPSLEGLYRNDRLMSDYGAVEMEFGLRLPLRRPGQTAAWQALADRWATSAAVRDLALRLKVAGQLRSAAWAWRMARVELVAAKTRLAQMLRDKKIVDGQIRLGEAAAVDRLAVDARLLQVRELVEARQADVAAATARWQRLTGLKRLPANLVEQPSLPKSGIDRAYLIKQHPMLRRIVAQVGLDGARLDAMRAAGAGSPELGLSVKRDRGDRNGVYDNSLMLSFSLPFGGQRYRNPQLAEISQQRARSQVELTRTATDIESRVAGLRARLARWQTRVAQLQQRADLSERQLKLKQKAQRLGELDWSRLLDFERQAAAARLAADLAVVSFHRDQANLNQALGELPGQSRKSTTSARAQVVTP